MGLSVAISGAIVLSVLMVVLMTMAGFVGNMFTIGDATSQISAVEKSISQTDISLDALEALTGSAKVNFTLNNDDTEKLWNFDDFNILIEYDDSPSSTRVEELSFNGDCLGSAPIAGQWCIEAIGADLLDEGIINNGESADIWTQVSLPLDNANALVTVSTDNGVVAKLPAPKRSWIDAAPIPPITCVVGNYGRTFVDTDTGLNYVCDPTRDKWLSIETITLLGEEDDTCGSGDDIGNNEHCSPDFGDQLGVNSNSQPDLGIYIPYNMTVIAYGFSRDDNSNCGSGSFDVEIWSTGSNSDDNSWTFDQKIDTGLTTQTENANDRNVDIAGDQYIMPGIENNCSAGSGDMFDWNLIIYSKWRHDNP